MRSEGGKREGVPSWKHEARGIEFSLSETSIERFDTYCFLKMFIKNLI